MALNPILVPHPSVYHHALALANLLIYIAGGQKTGKGLLTIPVSERQLWWPENG
ncbi:MAG: hypothetical protein WD668_01485 [Saccharospirillum sp.]